ncbi:MAG: class I SAM-dependent RNA methyltransferase [Bradymonadia bacterium]
MTLACGQQVTLVIERPAFGGRMVARAADGRIIFVRGGAPGDEVRVTLTRIKKQFAEGRVDQIISSGPGRVDAFCAHAEQCGGCPWQTTTGQLQHAALQAHTVRWAHRAEPSAQIAPIWSHETDRGWRSTARLQWHDGRVGFFQSGSNAVVPVASCPVLTPEVDALRSDVATLLSRQLKGRGVIRLTVAPGEVSGTVAIQPGEGAPRDLSTALDQLVARSTRCHGGVILGRRGRVIHETGRPENLLGTLGIPHPAGAFVQAHRPGNDALVTHVMAHVGAAAEPGASVVELFAGSGNFTVPLAQAGYQVHAVEHDGAAAQALRATLEARDELAASVLHLGNADQGPADLGRLSPALAQALNEAPVVILDPPRAGARTFASALHTTGAERVIYVACDPATLARDVGEMKAHWHLAHVQAFDLFPHTGHVETVAVLHRRRRQA